MKKIIDVLTKMNNEAPPAVVDLVAAEIEVTLVSTMLRAKLLSENNGLIAVADMPSIHDALIEADDYVVAHKLAPQNATARAIMEAVSTYVDNSLKRLYLTDKHVEHDALLDIHEGMARMHRGVCGLQVMRDGYNGDEE